MAKKKFNEEMSLFAKEQINKNPSNINISSIAESIRAEFKDTPSERNLRKHISRLVDSVADSIDNSVLNVSLDHYVQKFKAGQASNVNRTVEGDDEQIEYKGVEVVTNRDQAIKYFNIDTKKFEIVKAIFGQSSVTMKLKDWEIKTLDGKSKILYNQKPITIMNHSCKIFIRPRQKSKEEALVDVLAYVKKNSGKKYSYKKSDSNSNKAVWAASDFHLGLSNGVYNVDMFINRLTQMAFHINKYKASENHILFGGDLLENGTSTYMHTSQSSETDYELSGLRGGRVFWTLVNKYLFSKIANLSAVCIVHGNHDRTSISKKDATPNSSISEMFYWFCKDNLECEVKYDYFVQEHTVDNVSYLLTHGDTGMSKNTDRMVREYGNPNADYYVLVTGHLHSRKSKVSVVVKSVVFKDIIEVVESSANARSIQLPSFCGRNEFAKKGGWSSFPGFYRLNRFLSPSGNSLKVVEVNDIPLE
jgi:predicted phosphodiesterase